MQSPKVTICIPTYNGSRYLKECLNSCVDQTYNNMEVIVVDDCSSDSTTTIVKEFSNKYPAIKLHVNESNIGLVANWNKCIQLAKGEWIKYVFQDDYIECDCIEKFIKQVTSETMLMVSKRSFILPENLSDSLRAYYSYKVRTFDNLVVPMRNGFVSEETISKLAVENICLNFIAEPSLTFFRKSVTEELGYFNPALEQICDLEFFLRIASNYGVTYIPEQICHFRIHAQSTTSSNLEDKKFVLSHLDPILLANELLYSPNFNKFRYLISSFHRYKLKKYLEVRTYEAFRKSLLSKESMVLFNNVMAKYKEISKLKTPSVSTRLIYYITIFKRMLRK